MGIAEGDMGKSKNAITKINNSLRDISLRAQGPNHNLIFSASEDGSMIPKDRKVIASRPKGIALRRL